MLAMALNSKRRFQQVRVAVALLVGMSLVSLASAQNWQSIPPKLTDREARAMRVDQIVANPAQFQSEKAKVDEYFFKYYFPMLTSVNPDDLAELGDMREDLFRRYLRPAASNPAAFDYLTALCLKATQAIVRGNYHPASRYNAVLILGMLDQKPAGSGDQPTLPVPLPAATTDLLDLLEAEEFKKIVVHPAVKSGALEGLERQARFGIDPQQAERVKKVMLDLIASERPVPEVRRSVKYWIKRQAAGVLTYQFSTGMDAEVQAALNAMLTDEEMSLDDRCQVATYLSRVKYDQAADLNGSAAVAALGSLAISVMADEANAARDFEEEILEGNSGFSPRRARRSASRSRLDTQQGPTFGRSSLLSRLQSLTTAGKSLAAGVDATGKDNIHALLTAVDPVITSVSDKDSVDLDITGVVLTANRAVQNAVDAWAEPADAAAESADESFAE